MAVESKEVNKFTGGLVGTVSETDLANDFATFSLDIDSDIEKGSLRGIKGDYILDKENGWELPRYARWVIRLVTANSSTMNNTSFFVYGYNKTFLVLIQNSSTSVPASLQVIADSNNAEVVQVVWSDNDLTTLLSELKKRLSALTTPTILNNVSGIGQYFSLNTYEEIVSEADTRYYVIIRSNFLGNINPPESPLFLNTADANYSTDIFTSGDITTANILYPDSDKYSHLASWDSTRDGKFVRGNGMLPDSNSDDNPFSFKFLKPVNQKGSYNLFGITHAAKAVLLKNVGTDNFSSINLGNISSSVNGFNISAEQRNKNLYIGTGNLPSNYALWLGEIDRPQLDVNYDEQTILTRSSLEQMPNYHGELSLDNMVVPTLHYGLNSDNGGIAGSASIFANADGTDEFATSVSGHYRRTVNQWAMKCLENSTGTAPTNYSSFKRGMIFRLDLGQGLEATSNALAGAYDGATIAGDNDAFTHLRLLKSFTKGDITKSAYIGSDGHEDETPTSTSDVEIEDEAYTGHGTTDKGGTDAEALHTGDLFQIVHVPADGTVDKDSQPDGSPAGLIRFAYIGHLIGDQDEATHGDGTDDTTCNAHDSERAYSGMPAYVFGHSNDDSSIYRIKTTSKKDVQLKANNVQLTDSNGQPINMSQSSVEIINLAEELNVDNFQISTMSECKSTDGAGGFGGGFGHEHIFNITNRDFSSANNWTSAAAPNKFNTVNKSASSGATEGTFFTDNYLLLYVTSDASNTKTLYLDGAKFETGMESGKTYRVSYSIEISAYTSGTLTVGMGVDAYTIDSDSKKDYTATTGPTTDYFDFVYDGTTDHARLLIQASTSSAFTVYFDNFSIREVQKNYHMGYGKFWVANKNEHDKLYLVDLTNWDLIDASTSRVQSEVITLNFERLHPTLFSFDDTGVDNGMVRLHGEMDGSRLRDTVGDYQWDPIPTDQYISSICETYSHKPHLGDGSTNGNSIGDGRWRVWVSYNKTAESPHTRWDLFLFNFRPQGMINEYWGGASNANDVQDPIGVNSNYEVYMYDKTPSYQECAHITCGAYKNDENSGKKVYYPIDKFHFSRDERSGNDDRVKNFHDDGSSSGKGREQMAAIGGMAERQHYNDYADSQNLVNFRNPSGEWMSWKVFYGSAFDYEKYKLSFGGNLGWDAKPGNNNYRQWINYRHCLKPHFKEWYHTGTKSKKTVTENGVPVAHIVNIFGNLSGRYIKEGGELTAEKSDHDVSWYRAKTAVIEDYENQNVMFTQHDSPVAFCSLEETASDRKAEFSYGEIQGAPNNDSSNVTKAYNGSGTETIFNDTEAGWRTESSVPATVGFSRFNQYRTHHDWNGSKEVEKDVSGLSDMRAGYVNLDNTGYGGSYKGADGFGHYNNITTTWATNQEINFINRGWSTGNHQRVFGQGFEMYSIIERINGSEAVPEATTGFSVKDIGSDNTYVNRAGQSKSTILDMTRTAFGTGYLTYRWPHKDDPELAGSSGNPANFGGYGCENAGFYSDVAGSSGDMSGMNNNGFDGATTPDGTRWDNRKTVMCWNTTALTDSVYKKTDYSLNTHDSLNDFEVLNSPRSAMRAIDLGDDYEMKSIKSVDFISWQKINAGGTSSRKHGYIISGNAEKSPISDSATDSTIVTVIDPKCINFYQQEGYGVNQTDGGNTGDNQNLAWKSSQSKAANSKIVPLIKQYKNNKSDYFKQIVSYTNNAMLFKNLNQGLSDSPVKYDSNLDQRTFYADSGNVTQDVLLDVYCPIIVGGTGDYEQQSISVWARPQFNPELSGTTNGPLDEAAGSSYTKDFPYYKYDRLWNFWSTSDASPNNKSGYSGSFDVEAGFDRAVLQTGEGIATHKRPTEGWGSTAGTTISTNSEDGIYPTYNSSTTTYYDVDNTHEVVGAHTKLYRKQLLYKDHEEPADVVDGENVGVEFKANSVAYYKLSYVYDGFQEAPLSKATFKEPISVDSKYIKLIFEIPSSSFLNLNPRVTHINIYRKNEINALYRLVKSVSLKPNDNQLVKRGQIYRYKFNDESVGVSYEGLNGVSETLDNFTPNYSLSCQLNDFLFVAKINHPEIQNGEHIMLRSKQGKFSIFDWSNDFLDLPTQPVAIASFANRIFMWDENNTYIINPQEMYIEEKTEGIGILNSKSFVVTDIGLFFADRNNIYIHNGKEAVSIGNPILYNHSRPEYQIGYLDAIKKAETLGYTPRVVFDSPKQCLYVILQGFNDADTQNFNTSYKSHQSRAYAFTIKDKRWDYFSCPNVKSVATTGKGEVVFNDGYQVYNYRVDKRNKKAFTWESKEFIMNSPNFEKSFKRLYVRGEVCLNTFNNYGAQATATDNLEGSDWGFGAYEQVDDNYITENESHNLNTEDASENDDLKVYVDGVLKTMRVQNRKAHIGDYLANDKTKSIYTVETHLPIFNTASNGLKNPAGGDLNDAFSISTTSIPEFMDPPHSKYDNKTKQGESNELVHIHRGQYLYFSGTDSNGKFYEEFVRVRNIYLDWLQSTSGENEINTSPDSVKISTFRGQLGTKAVDWYGGDFGTAGVEINPIRTAMPVLKFPSGTKGKSVKIVFKNQKSFIDSFAVTYRKKRIK
tara:strand:+ start:786 stop:8504 length:7719 start_codon:yes stop_codon:yes gene_type:complete